jgi:hypothetical protein
MTEEMEVSKKPRPVILGIFMLGLDEWQLY